MVNPRQRSKKRSGSFRPVQHSKHAKRNLKKQPPIRGSRILQDSWDKHKTVKQNYDALGLVATLKPNESGGTEHNRYGKLEDETRPSTSTLGDPKDIAALSAGARIPAGYGRIRNVETMDDMDHAYLDEKSATTWTQLGPRTATGAKRPNSVVQELEKISEDKGKRGAPRCLSEGEAGYLARLVGRHREDVEAMARDRKLNPDQRTAGELRRLIRKAGGFEGVLGSVG